MRSGRQPHSFTVKSSKPRWIREQRPSEKELLESLCSEIQSLRHHSKLFETQYRSLQRYYHSLSRQVIPWI
ncbi:MAG: hypothetical protein OEL56_03845 [Nitrosopumilus sp.]|nr:hypothetical protein [Nitrosopumilus sp.]MDH3565024.1 hypothetical protein [Nitrosopumilus sp.]MDH5416447.1 hypothetical protein [Nitrosopumilus sp.]MDH5553647.1 hypothetical protein [Nitrosopumilus sp.]